MDVPDCLYRYYSLSGKNREFAIECLSSKTIYFAKPAHLNDPQECLFTCSIPGRYRLRMFLEASKDDVPGVNNEWRKQGLIVADSNVNWRDPGEEVVRSRFRKGKWRDSSMWDVLQMTIPQSFRQQLISMNSGILCLTADPSQTLMWSHYAAGHTGICLGFDTSRGAIFRQARPVTYSDDPLHIDLDSFELSRLAPALLTKAKHWAYEREWRILALDNGAGVRPFEPAALAHVIFGSRTATTDITIVSSIVRRWSSAHFCRVEENRLGRGYNLELRPL